MNLTMYQIDSFTKKKFKGNPAGVVLNANGLSEEQMQLIARELNNSETAFLFSPDDDICDGRIRYFTPQIEVPSCGHATIAAMYAKAHEDNLDSCILRMKTKIGILPIEIIKNEDKDYQVIMNQGEFKLSSELDELIIGKILKAFNLNREDLNKECPIQIASTGHSKVMIGIKNKSKLDILKPNFYELIDLSKKIECNGYFVFTFDSNDSNILTFGRMFAPAIGINEDPTTGNANGPLGGYLIQNRIVNTKNNYFEFNGKQGEALGRPGIVNVRVKFENNKPSLIQIKGDAVIVFKTEIRI